MHTNLKGVENDRLQAYKGSRIRLGGINMCEYCEEYSNPISFPQKFIFDNGKQQIIFHGFHINKKDSKIEFFEKYDENKEKIILFEREINYCPMCGRYLKESEQYD